MAPKLPECSNTKTPSETCALHVRGPSPAPTHAVTLTNGLRAQVERYGFEQGLEHDRRRTSAPALRPAAVPPVASPTRPLQSAPRPVAATLQLVRMSESPPTRPALVSPPVDYSAPTFHRASLPLVLAVSPRLSPRATPLETTIVNGLLQDMIRKGFSQMTSLTEKCVGRPPRKALLDVLEALDQLDAAEFQHRIDAIRLSINGARLQARMRAGGIRR